MRLRCCSGCALSLTALASKPRLQLHVHAWMCMHACAATWRVGCCSGCHWQPWNGCTVLSARLHICMTASHFHSSCRPAQLAVGLPPQPSSCKSPSPHPCRPAPPSLDSSPSPNYLQGAAHLLASSPPPVPVPLVAAGLHHPSFDSSPIPYSLSTKQSNQRSLEVGRQGAVLVNHARCATSRCYPLCCHHRHIRCLPCEGSASRDPRPLPRFFTPTHQAAVEAAAAFLGSKQKPVALAGSLLRV